MSSSTQSPREPQYPIHEVFTQRWSPRAFTSDTLSEETLLSFFEAARWAPSSSNVQPWRFVYARRQTPAWAPIFDTLVPFNQTWAQQAAALVVVASCTTWAPPGRADAQAVTTHAFDTGAAWASFALQATLSGWSTHGMGGFDADRLAQAIALPPDHAVHAVIAVGRMGDKSQLPQALQAREFPSDRVPQAQWTREGRFST